MGGEWKRMIKFTKLMPRSYIRNPNIFRTSKYSENIKELDLESYFININGVEEELLLDKHLYFNWISIKRKNDNVYNLKDVLTEFKNNPRYFCIVDKLSNCGSIKYASRIQSSKYYNVYDVAIQLLKLWSNIAKAYLEFRKYIECIKTPVKEEIRDWGAVNRFFNTNTSNSRFSPYKSSIELRTKTKEFLPIGPLINHLPDASYVLTYINELVVSLLVDPTHNRKVSDVSGYSGSGILVKDIGSDYYTNSILYWSRLTDITFSYTAEEALNNDKFRNMIISLMEESTPPLWKKEMNSHANTILLLAKEYNNKVIDLHNYIYEIIVKDNPAIVYLRSSKYTTSADRLCDMLNTHYIIGEQLHIGKDEYYMSSAEAECLTITEHLKDESVQSFRSLPFVNGAFIRMLGSVLERVDDEYFTLEEINNGPSFDPRIFIIDDTKEKGRLNNPLDYITDTRNPCLKEIALQKLYLLKDALKETVFLETLLLLEIVVNSMSATAYSFRMCLNIIPSNIQPSSIPIVITDEEINRRKRLLESYLNNLKRIILDKVGILPELHISCIPGYATREVLHNFKVAEKAAQGKLKSTYPIRNIGHIRSSNTVLRTMFMLCGIDPKEYNDLDPEMRIIHGYPSDERSST